MAARPTTKNRKLTLPDAVAELECRGFSCATADADAGFSDSDDVVLGTLSICAWWNPVVLKRHVFVRRVFGAESLTVERIERDLCRIDLFAEERRWGCSHGFMALVYLVEEEEGDDDEGEVPQQQQHRRLRQRRPPSRTTLDPNVVSFVGAKPENEAWRISTMLAVQDGTGNSFFYEGDEIEPELKYWAGLLTGRPGIAASLPPYHLQKRKFAFLLSTWAFGIPVLCRAARTDPRFVLRLLLSLFSLVIPPFAVLTWRARRRRRRKRAEIFARNCGGGPVRV